MSDQLAECSSRRQEAEPVRKAVRERAEVDVDDFDRGRPDALLARRVRATRTGLRLSEGLTFETWRRIGLQAGVLNDSSAWWIGDWLLYGQRTYGERYKTAIEATGFGYQTLRNYAWVASRIPLSRRRDTLSFGHHAEIAALDEEEQEKWLRGAATRRWSRNELRRQIRAARSVPVEPVASSVAIALRVEDPRHERWRAAAAAEGRAFGEWIAGALDEAADSVLEGPAIELAI
jgi:hypothetical protein